MGKKFSQSTCGIYIDGIHVNIPEDAIEITDDEHLALLVGDMAEACIGHDETGKPVKIERSPPSTADIWLKIKAERDRRSEQGGYKVGANWFHSDQKSRSQQLGLVLLGANIPTGLQWKTMDGSFVTMTETLAQQILAAGAASDQAIFGAAETHKAAMEASADPASYDFSAGWPATFAG